MLSKRMGEWTRVLVDVEDRAPVPVPEDVRSAIRAFEGDDLAA
jgi:acyl-CoA thioesterase FadM